MAGRGGGEASDVARGVVIRIAIRGGTVLLDDRPPPIRVPRDGVAGCGHSIQAGAAIVGGQVFSEQALAPDHVCRLIRGPLIPRTKAAELRRACGIYPMVWARVVDRECV